MAESKGSFFSIMFGIGHCGFCKKRCSPATYKSIIILNCKHKVCSECLLTRVESINDFNKSIIESAIENEGNLQKFTIRKEKVSFKERTEKPVNIQCPECKVVIGADIFESLLEPEMYKKFLKLSIQQEIIQEVISGLKLEPHSPKPAHKEKTVGKTVRDDPDIVKVSTQHCTTCKNPMHPENVIEFGCGHSNSCQNCVKKLLTSLIQKGSVQKLHCPEAGCKVEASQTLIKSLVERDVFEKFENLILNDALRNVPEIVYCPRIQCGREIVAELEVGYCPWCEYRFCTKCNEEFHGSKVRCENRGEEKRPQNDKATTSRKHKDATK